MGRCSRHHDDGIDEGTTSFDMPGTMQVPAGVTIEDMERFFGRKAVEVKPELLRIENFKIQPMKLPSSLIFYFDMELDKGTKK
jgi:hypothetical protein